jgi:hypothetical protein
MRILILLFVVMGFVGSVDAGIVSYYNYDVDNKFQRCVTGNDENISVMVNALWSSPGKVGDGSVMFDGNGDCLRGVNNFGNELTNEMTVSAWVMPAVSPISGRVVAGTTGSAPVGWYLGSISGSTDVLSFWVYGYSGQSGGAVKNGFYSQYLGIWTHVVGTFKGGNFIRLYINGSLVDSDVSAVPMMVSYANNTFITVGGRADASSSGWWSGEIDELRIYDYAFTDSEVINAYNGVFPELAATTTERSYKKLVALSGVFVGGLLSIGTILAFKGF